MRRSYRRVSGAVAGVASLITAMICGVSSPVGASSVTPGTAAQVKALVAASIHITRANNAVLSEVEVASSDTWAVEFHIPPDTSCLTATSCVYGDASGPNTIVLYGDSHARMWLPALNTIAIDAKARLVLLGQDGCPVDEANLAQSPVYASSCPTVQTDAISVITKLKPETVIIANSTYDTHFSAAQWEAGMEKTFASLAPSKAKVVLLQDATEFTAEPPACIAQHPTAIQTDCAVKNPNAAMTLRSTSEQAAAKAKKIAYVLTDQWFCTTTRCSPVVGNFVTHFDRGHITASYATYLTTVLAASLKGDIKS